MILNKIIGLFYFIFLKKNTILAYVRNIKILTSLSFFGLKINNKYLK